MKLYHFTHPGTVMLIAASGLRPAARPDQALMTGGAPVVWLTLEESNIASPEDIAHFESCGAFDFKDGDIKYGGRARVTVQVERHNKRLMRYVDFLRQNGADMDVFRTVLSPSARTKWWVYLGEIPARKIDPTVPAAVMLECLEHHIATHPVAKARNQYSAMREQVLPLPPDAPVIMTLA